MSTSGLKSEIRSSVIRDLIDKARKQNFKWYLASLRLEKIRMFSGAQINFDFPVTALIGPNGGGKSTILGAAACAYLEYEPHKFFRKSRVGDDSMDGWVVEYEAVDKGINPKGTVRTRLTFQNEKWEWSERLHRPVRILGITRTLPSIENPQFQFRKKLSTFYKKENIGALHIEKMKDIDHIKKEAERILGKSLANFDLYEITANKSKVKQLKKIEIVGYRILEDGSEVPIIKNVPTGETVEVSKHGLKQLMYVGSDGRNSYSEFNFGAGETSIIRMVAEIESLPPASLVLIEEIENGLHPLAVRRTVDYLIDVSQRKGCQVIFTTHSDYALELLPSEAIWATIDGRLQQGKLSVEILRAVSGRVDKRLAVFVEDDFAKTWVETVIRESLGESFEEVGVYPVYGDGNAVKIHVGHVLNPAITFRSICIVDGDSRQPEDADKFIFRLPGTMPEATVFNAVLSNLDSNIALLTAACQRPLDKQDAVAKAIKAVSTTNRDPHLLFSQVGMKIGFIPEAVVRGAFLTVWMQENPAEVAAIVDPIKHALSLPPKGSD